MQSKKLLYGVHLSGKQKFQAVAQLIGKVARMGTAVSKASIRRLKSVKSMGGSDVTGTGTGTDQKSSSKTGPGSTLGMLPSEQPKRPLSGSGRSMSARREAQAGAGAGAAADSRTRRSSREALRVHAEGVIFHTERMAMPPLRAAAMQFELPLAAKEIDILRPGWTHWHGFDVFQANREVLRVHGVPVTSESAVAQMYERVKSTYIPSAECM